MVGLYFKDHLKSFDLVKCANPEQDLGVPFRGGGGKEGTTWHMAWNWVYGSATQKVNYFVSR